MAGFHGKNWIWPMPSEISAPDDHLYRRRRVHGRRLGRPLHQVRVDALDLILPQCIVGSEFLSEKGDVPPDSLFGMPVKKLHVEIGFGNGEHLHYIMRENPDDFFIGAEPFVNGMSAFLKDLPDPVPANIRVHMDDALMVLNSLTDESVDVLYILNPDPWPKSRHHKRRIVSEENLKVYARVLKDGGLMVQTTDVDELAEWMLTKTVNCPDFEWLAEKPEDWKKAPNGWMATRYENKGKDAGRSQTYLLYARKSR